MKYSIRQLVETLRPELPYPEFANKMSARGYDLFKPYFTGWKGAFVDDLGIYVTLQGISDPFLVEIPDLSDVRYVGQWLYYDGVSIYWACAPSMTAGKVDRGGTFQTGNLYLTRNSSIDEQESACKFGYQTLMFLLKEMGIKYPCEADASTPSAASSTDSPESSTTTESSEPPSSPSS